MMIRRKYLSVNWVNGMKLSGEHLSMNDFCTMDMVRDMGSVFIHSFNFGILPPYSGDADSLQLLLKQGIGFDAEIILYRCNAITADGVRIEIGNHAYVLNEELSPGCSINFKTSDLQNYLVMLEVAPVENYLMTGIHNPEESPLRYPFRDKRYELRVIPEMEVNGSSNNPRALILGKLIKENGQYRLEGSYVPPCTCMLSHPLLIDYFKYYETALIGIEHAVLQIVKKIHRRKQQSLFSAVLTSFCRLIADVIAGGYFRFRQGGLSSSPFVIIAYFSAFAHRLFVFVSCLPEEEQEELLTYFCNWINSTPGNFMCMLTDVANISYDHYNISSRMKEVKNMLNVLENLFNILSSLDYAGQRKDNVVVAETNIGRSLEMDNERWKILD